MSYSDLRAEESKLIGSVEMAGRAFTSAVRLTFGPVPDGCAERLEGVAQQQTDAVAPAY